MQETLSFQSNGLRLHGILHLPEASGPAPLVIGCHGMLSTGESPKQQVLADECNRLGIAYFRFDHRGCGQSDGDFAEVTTFEGRCADLRAAIEMLKRRPDLQGPLGLFGSSLGGAVVLWVAGIFNVRAIVTLAAPVRFGAIKVPLSYDTDPAFAGMKKEQMVFDVSGRLSLVSNLLICHGGDDQVVPFENADEIYAIASEPKEMVHFEGADHLLSRIEHQQEFMKRTVGWFEKKLKTKA